MNFSDSYADFGDIDVSDHRPCCLIMGTSKRPKVPFKISHFLFQHKEFLPRTAIHWSETLVNGSCMFQLSVKLKLLKSVLKDLNREYFSDLENRVKEAHSMMVDCHNRVLSNPSPHLATLEKHAHHSWLTLSLAEEKFLCQKSRVKWVECGDSNTAYFHKMVATRRSINQIHYLIDNEGVKLEKSDDIQAHCITFFNDLFGGVPPALSVADKELIGSLTPFKCNEATKLRLAAFISAEEIKREVFSLPCNRSPGPDGFTGEFFKVSWDIIGEDFTRAVREFFASGQMLRQWNATAITLVPKIVGAVKLGDFRPISCCNVIYKVVSKILARRLESLLPSIISNSQSAFVKGRLLVENVLLASEMVQGFDRVGISQRGLLKVDLRKAFDSVKWDFLSHILEAADFPPIFSNWIMQCLTTTSFSINVNGELCGYFKGNKGLRQGDPLSPPLFLLAMEIFANILSSKYADGAIGYHPLGRNPQISHLAFADDVMLFFDGKVSSLQAITSTLDRFQALSGLSMNKEKTSLFYAGLNQIEAASLSQLGFNLGSLPIRYLGLPLLHRKLRKSDYSPLLDKITARFNSWTVKYLSFSGRLQLISAVIYSLVNFWFSAFALPKGCLKDIEKLCNRFLWSGDLSKCAAAKVSWSTVCLPKSEGGLGLRNLLIWNKVLNMRLVWLLFSSAGSLWVAWTKEHYFKMHSFWYVEAQPNASWVWKFILDLMPMAKALIACKLGDGINLEVLVSSWDFMG